MIVRSHLPSLLLAASALGLVLTSCGQPDSSPTAKAPPVSFPVETTKSSVRDVSRLISLPADVRPWEEATLAAKVPGYLTSISVDKGDTVAAGQLLAVVGTPELQADADLALQNYKASSAAAEGSISASAKASAEVERAKSAKQKAAADLGQSVASVAKARAQLRQAEEAVKQAQEAKSQATANLGEALAQVKRSESNLSAAQADQQLADVTFKRYQSIYAKNHELIAKQDVDTAETKAVQAREKVKAAQSEVDASKQKVIVARSQSSSSDSAIRQANEQVTIAQEQVKLSIAQQESSQKQVEVAAKDIDISAKQRDVSKSEVQKSQFQASAGKSALDRQSSLAGYAQIKAPFAGVITKRSVDQGALMQVGNAIVTVANAKTLRIMVNVPENEVRFIHPQGKVKITFTSLPDEKVEGTIARTSSMLDSKTRTLLAEVDIPNPDGKILAGSYATVKVVLETHTGVVSIPSAAVGSDKSGKFVFINDNGKAKRVPIKVGFDDGSFTEITDGLKADTEVVVTGRDPLNPGSGITVKPWDPDKKPKS